MVRALHQLQDARNIRRSIHAVVTCKTACKERSMRTRLAEHRQRLRLSQEEMAERLGSSVSQLSRWETGRSNIPSGKMLDVANAYGIHVAEIFEFDDGASELSLEGLEEMVRNAQAEMSAGTTFADWPKAVASSLWDQLKAIETAGGVRLERELDDQPLNIDSKGRIKRR
ncbi:helix-turn-helix transcriptional regulator [Sphingobium yanoikuyae]|uniref:helix-turn-helix transcriptional regulator n=1 Tax=Sphingobium yanoikuyae TaxID=13690 RepID=UPI00242D3FBB|nr:helix-turn-helix transcriptional regulator [Sphingobium yanoikuyae]